jgi:hypothetical protein
MATRDIYVLKGQKEIAKIKKRKKSYCEIPRQVPHLQNGETLVMEKGKIILNCDEKINVGKSFLNGVKGIQYSDAAIVTNIKK